jgi:competence protein ComEC
MKRPLVGMAIIYSLGILSSNKIIIPLTLIYLLPFILLLLCFFFIRKYFVFNIFIACLIFTLGVISLKNSQNLGVRHISKIAYYKNKGSYTVRGAVISKPKSKNNKTSFIFKAQTIKSDKLSYPCNGNILVYLRTKQDLSYGEELILRGNLYRPFSGSGKFGKSYRNYLYNQDIWFIMNVKTEADYIRLNKNSGFMLKRLALWLENKMEGIIFCYTTPGAAGILDAMILGEKKYVPWFVNNAMMKSGTIHILVVSGFNVGIVSFVVLLFLKLIRLPRKARFLLTIPCLVVYCLMTGASNPVVRATLMAIVFIVGALVKREPDIYNSCALAWIFILLFNPRQLFDIGFQLSFACVICLIYLYPKMRILLRIKLIQSKCLKFLLDGLLVSLSCWLGTMGFIAHYFKMFSPVTVVANVFIVPLATLITLCGFTMILIGSLFPGLAWIFANTCDFLVVFLVKLNAFLINLPAAYLFLS